LKKENIPGWIVMLLLAIIATFIAGQAQGVLESFMGELKKNPV